MLLRQGAVYALSARLKINSKSSTVDKHVGVYELLAAISNPHCALPLLLPKRISVQIFVEITIQI